MRRLVLPALFVVVLVMATWLPAAADNEWCDTDPLLVIQTPAGNLVPVYVDVGAQSSAYTVDTLASSLQMAYRASSASNGAATLVQVYVTVPTLGVSSFATRELVSSGALNTGTLYAQTQGTSGQTMTATFSLNVP